MFCFRFTICALLLPLASISLAAELRYVARFADGTRHEGNSLVNWHEINAQPQLEGKSLWDPANPFRWLRDRTLSPPLPPKAYVEFVTGDRLPGTVVGFAAAGEKFDPLAAHFLVEPSCSLRPPQPSTQDTIRVLASQVRKLVWHAREKARYQPSTLLLRDGSTLPFRAIRFDDGFASVLTSTGNRRVAFGEIAEAHLPATNYWEAYLDEIATLSPQGDSRLYQLETTEGLVVTGSKDRLAIHSQGGANEPHRWFHGLQPSWSLDLLWVANETVWLRRSFTPYEVPLSRVPPTHVKYDALLGKLGEPWQRDRNLALEPLRSGEHEWGFGFGSATTTELSFELPPGAKSIKGAIGLDRLAGKGGCAKGSLFFGVQNRTLLWESPVLQGSDLAHEFGPLPSPAPMQSQTLTLRADAFHVGRPAGADPLEIRDFVDWLDPLIEFDPAVWLPAIRERIPGTLPVFAQWQVDLPGADAAKPPKFVPFLQAAPSPGQFRTGVLLDQPLVISRKLTPTANDQWLVMHVTRPVNQGAEPKLEVRFQGELVGEFKIPMNAANVRPLAVPLMGFQGARSPEIDVKLTLYSEPGSSPIELRSLTTAEQLPTLYRVFEEENHFTQLEGKAPALAEGDARFGVQSLKLTGGSAARIAFNPPLLIREQLSWETYRQLRFTFRKQGQGSVQLEFEGAGGDRRRVMHFGPRKAAEEGWVVVQDRELPDEWIHDLTRDLYGDFGSFDLEAITLRVPDGEYALWDHIYLASQWEDLNQITKTPSLEKLNRKRDREVSEKLVTKIKPAIALVDFGDGRIGNAVMTNYTGELLTAGHLMIAPNREVTVTLADGKVLKAKTRGIWRDRDLGLIKCDEQGGYPQVGTNTWMELSTQQLCVAAAYAKNGKPENVSGEAVDLRRIFNGTVWTTFELPGGLTGGPLVDHEGSLLGILTRYSPFGGAEYGLTHKINEVEGKLRNGEVWGEWRAGTGPTFGFTAEPTQQGARITALETGGPVANPPLQKGDVIVTLDAQAVRGLGDIYSHTSTRDVDYEATFEVLRGEQRLTVKVKLGARNP